MTEYVILTEEGVMLDVLSLDKESLASYKLRNPKHTVTPTDKLDEEFLLNSEQDEEDELLDNSLSEW